LVLGELQRELAGDEEEGRRRVKRKTASGTRIDT